MKIVTAIKSFKNYILNIFFIELDKALEFLYKSKETIEF